MFKYVVIIAWKAYKFKKRFVKNKIALIISFHCKEVLLLLPLVMAEVWNLNL